MLKETDQSSVLMVKRQVGPRGRHSSRAVPNVRLELPRFSGQLKTVGIGTEVRDSQW